MGKKKIRSSSSSPPKETTRRYKQTMQRQTENYRRQAIDEELSRKRKQVLAEKTTQQKRQMTAEAAVRKRRRTVGSEGKVRRAEETKEQGRRRKQATSQKISRHRKKAQNRRRNVWIYRILTWVIILIAGYFAAAVFFKINAITIVGDTRYPQKEILETLGIQKGDNLFLIDRSSAEKRLLDQYIYLDNVKLRRKLPSTLEVDITETEAVAAVQSSDHYFLINSKGKILEKAEEDTAKKYTLLFGLDMKGIKIGDNLIERGGERTKELFHLVSLLKEKNMSAKTSYIDVEKISSINIGYDGRLIVKFGTLEDIEQKIRFLAEITDERLSPSDTGLIDISEGNTARFRPLSTLSQEELSSLRNFDGTERSTEYQQQAT